MEDASELYQFSSVYRHFVLNKYAVVRGEFGNTRFAKSYYLCTVVLFDIPKDSDIINSYELLPEVVSDKYVRYRHRERGKVGRQHGDRIVNSKKAITHVDSDTFPSKSTRSTDTVNVIFTISAYEAAPQ